MSIIFITSIIISIISLIIILIVIIKKSKESYEDECQPYMDNLRSAVSMSGIDLDKLNCYNPDGSHETCRSALKNKKSIQIGKKGNCEVMSVMPRDKPISGCSVCKLITEYAGEDIKDLFDGSLSCKTGPDCGPDICGSLCVGSMSDESKCSQPSEAVVGSKCVAAINQKVWSDCMNLVCNDESSCTDSIATCNSLPGFEVNPNNK